MFIPFFIFFGGMTAQRKYLIMKDILEGSLPIAQAKHFYNLGDEELMHMAHAYHTKGQNGLKIKNMRMPA